MSFVGKVSDVAPGQLIMVSVEGERVAVANVEGQLFAISDVCPHAGCPLSKGEISGHIVTCPCHEGEFDLTNGQVVGGPPFEDVATYAVEVVGDEFRIGKRG